jgi:hypothetical protein
VRKKTKKWGAGMKNSAGTECSKAGLTWILLVTADMGGEGNAIASVFGMQWRKERSSSVAAGRLNF